MTSLDKAFIKAYASRRSLRGAMSDTSVTLGETQRGGVALRVDAAHTSGQSRSGGPHTKPARKPRRPSTETSPLAETARVAETDQLVTAEAPPHSATLLVEEVTRRERLVVTVGETVLSTDWVWQREPHPVFADQASTADPIIAATLTAAPSFTAPKPPAGRPSPGRLLSPEVLSLGLASPSTALPTTPQRLQAAIGGINEPPFSAAPAPRFEVVAPPAEPIASQAESPYAKMRAPVLETPRPGSATAPLSSFSIMPRAGEKLQPALEVDRFIWPAECLALHETTGGALESFAARLSANARGGKRKVALVGATAGAGTTTTCLSLARLAHARQAVWGLLDADFASASLASQLGIGQVSGWQAVLAGRQRLADIAIASLDDRLILVPLSTDAIDGEELSAHYRLSGMVSTLADAVELLLVDAGTVGDADSLAALVRSARIDLVYLVYDERSMSPREMAACVGRLRAAEIPIDGTIANFADA